MLITETVTIEREIHVAPCLECRNTDIQLSDSNYSSFNMGGGKCLKCKRSTISEVGCLLTLNDLAQIWNAGNDISLLLNAQNTIIANANIRIAELKAKQGPVLTPLTSDEESTCLFAVTEFLEGGGSGMLTSDDGHGLWATSTHKSKLYTSAAQPEWATHVVWYNK